MAKKKNINMDEKEKERLQKAGIYRKKAGRPKGSKNKKTPKIKIKYNKRGRPHKQEVKAMLTAKGIIDHGVEGFYAITHPNSKPHSTKVNAKRMVTPEVIAYVDRLLHMEQLAETTRTNLEKFFYLVVARWLEGKEKTSDYLRALESLKQLVEDFKQTVQIDDISKKSHEELDKEINELVEKYRRPVNNGEPPTLN